MAKQFAYRAQMEILQGGYPGEDTGVSPADSDWHTTDQLTGSSTHTYYYRDSGCGNDNNSSKVEVTITDSWTASFDNRNNLTVQVHSVVDSIVRGDIRGNPNACGTIMVRIHLKRERNGGDVAVYPNGSEWMNMNFSGTIASNVDLGTYSFTIAPGQELSRGTLYLYNDAQSGFDDEFEMGIFFKNIMPPDYRPGAVFNGSGSWLSHNRNSGKAHILTTGGTYSEMRTDGGGSEKGNPPSIRKSDTWTNQLLIGKDQ